MPKGQTLGEVEQESAHDTIAAIMAEATAGGKTPTIDGPPAEKPRGSDVPSEQVAPKATATSTPKETDAEAKARQDRDERGRFKTKAAEEAAAATKNAPETPAASAAPAAAAPVASNEPEPIDPPTEWKAAEQETFRALPRPAQEFLLAKYNASREAETRAGQTAGKYSALEQMLAPRRAALQRDGLDEVSYLQYLDRLSQSAAQDPKGFVRWFAQQRGIRPEEVFGQPQQAPAQPGQPPQGADPYINKLEQRLGQFESWMHNQARTAEEAQQRALVTEISSFGTAKDDKGKLAHPYFEEVRPLMGSLLKTEQASDLQVAYDMACRAHPEVSRKIAGAAQAAAERDRQAEQRKKAEAARNAGSSISGTPGDRSAAPPSGDVREELRRQFAAKGLIGA
jgi:hypothetical protein